MRLIMFLLFALFSLHALAGDVVIVGVKTFGGPGSESDEFSVRMSDGVITAIGEGIETGGSTVHAGKGGYITPGLIDSGSTLGIQEVDLSTSAEDQRYDGTAMSAGFDPLLAYNRNSTLIPSILSEGVTHVQVRPVPGKDVFSGQGGLVRIDQGLVAGAQRVVYVHLGEGGRERAGKSRAAALQRLVLGLKEAALYKAKKKAYESNRMRELAFSLDDLEALASVLEGKSKLALAVDRAAEIESVLNALDAFDLDLVLLGAREAWQVTEAILSRDIPVVINVLDNRPSSFDRLGVRIDQARLLHDAGITFAFMTENIFSESRMLTQSAGVAVAYGLPWQAALDAITSSPAKIWGVNGSLGELVVGKDATFVIWDGDPFELTSQPTHIVIKGEFVEIENRQDQLRDRYKTLTSEMDQPFSYR